MLDISFGKLLLLAIVALVVLGPERLPHAARTAGTLLRRVRSSWQSVQAEVEREIAADEMRRNLDKVTQEVATATSTVHQQVSQMRTETHKTFQGGDDRVSAPSDAVAWESVSVQGSHEPA